MRSSVIHIHPIVLVTYLDLFKDAAKVLAVDHHLEKTIGYYQSISTNYQAEMHNFMLY